MFSVTERLLQIGNGLLNATLASMTSAVIFYQFEHDVVAAAKISAVMLPLGYRFRIVPYRDRHHLIFAAMRAERLP
jgi:hypothetical protein